MYNRKYLSINSLSGWGVVLGMMLFVLVLISTNTYRKGLVELSDEGVIRLELFVTYLRGVLTKYESLPELLARDEQLAEFLLNAEGNESSVALNKYLETINDISNAADTYLMDREGLTIAASNWQEEHPFVGRNFSYRPYFQQAMKGQLGRYFALGTTSSKRGYYFAYPVRRDREILGAVVIKINIDTVEKKWGYHDETFLVTDPDGVIFITTRPEWRFASLERLNASTRELIEKSKRYPNSDINALPITNVKDYQFGSVINLQPEGGKSQIFLQQTHRMQEAGWSVHVLTSVKPLRRKIFEVNILLGSSLVFLYLLLVLFKQRQLRLVELKRIQDTAREVLQEANEKLETRVKERTHELVETNEQLRREIQDRKNTEDILKRTRSELIHAAKMATLGQMSAGINHELNQPLAAIRSYSDNARLLLGKNRADEAAWSMSQIGELTDRMAQLGVRLKEFSRKSSGKRKVVYFQDVIDGALEILFPAIKRNDVQLHIDIVPEDIKLLANQVLLQQVMVNLLGNAIHAVEGQPKKDIQVELRVVKDRAIIKVRDSGHGIPFKYLKTIFDPFYTTKKSGKGLGLGLTITERILNEMGGDIKAVKSNDGALFIFSLQVSQERHESE